jgi:AcrR family transcriptional regulator
MSMSGALGSGSRPLKTGLAKPGQKIARPNKHQLRTDATRLALLEAARRVFAGQGFEASRIEDIAAATGHTRGAFYAHFATKEDLFFALLEQEASRRVHQIRATMESREDPELRLEALRSFYIGLIADPQWVMLMLEFRLFALRHPKLRARLAETHRRIRSSLKLEVIDRLLPERLRASRESEELRKLALDVILNGLVLEHAYDPERISEEQLVGLLGRLFDVLIQPKQTASSGENH